MRPLTADACAALMGDRTRGTWLQAVRARGAPAHRGYDPDTGQKVWDADEVDAWLSQRPGQGARTDRRRAER